MVTVEGEPVGREERRGQAAILRRIWRLHFWVGLFAAPVLVVLACTGLIILYTQPLDLWLHRDLQVVSPATATVSLDDQIATARQARRCRHGAGRGDSSGVGESLHPGRLSAR